MGDYKIGGCLCTPAILTEWALTDWLRNGDDEMKTFLKTSSTRLYSSSESQSPAEEYVHCVDKKDKQSSWRSLNMKGNLPLNFLNNKRIDKETNHD